VDEHQPMIAEQIIKTVNTNFTAAKRNSLRFNGHFPGEPGLAGLY